MTHVRGAAIAAITALWLAGCTAPVAVPDIDRGVQVLLLGEQHDAGAHQRMHRAAIEDLAARGRLAAVALEMAEQGHSTAGLPRDTQEADVRQALDWNEETWPWRAYEPAVMAAVHAGVPVLGANLPRAQMRAAMADAQLDTLLGHAALNEQQQRIRDGHCTLLPEVQVAPMARVQIARDRAMAATVARAARPERVVILIAGGGHVEPTLGVPVHLPPGLRVEVVRWPAQPPARDYCADLKQQLARP